MPEAIDRVGLAAGLESAGIAWRELDDGERSDFAVDGVEPIALCWPASADEAAKALALADRLGLAVAPRGAGTKTGIGNRPRRCDLVVSTERLNQLVEYAPANLTVTVEAGVSLADLQARLATDGQQLALDPPYAAKATIGGILATNSSGPRRLGYGAARDLVIGTRAATTSGSVVRSGGRVVKNVAGYDLGKLYIGSLGTLVLLVEVGLKVMPIPAAQTTVVGRFTSLDRLADVSRHIARSPLMPLALEVLNLAAASRVEAPVPTERGSYLLVALGAAPGGGVRRQADEFARRFADGGAAEVVRLGDDDGRAFWSRLSAGAECGDSHRSIQAKVAAPPGRLLDVWKILEGERGELGDDPAIGGRAASGIFNVVWSLPKDNLKGSDASIAATIQSIRRQLAGFGASMVIETCPLAVKQTLDVWGDVGASLAVMKRLKEVLDPHDCLNPGRFVGGI